MSDYDFDGDTFDIDADLERLSVLLDRVRFLMSDGKWRTLDRIKLICGGTEASVSARLRDLRKEKFGARTVDRRRVPDADGLHEYRLVPVFSEQMELDQVRA